MSSPRPTVLFVCVKNGGKSQIAAALMRHHAGDRVEVHSAGTHPASGLNEEARASVEQVGATMAGEHPKPVDPTLLARADRVVVIGTEAVVEAPAGRHVEVWDTDEPSARGITGPDRMTLVRDDIDARVRALAAELLA